MDDAEAALQQQLPDALRQLQPTALDQDASLSSDALDGSHSDLFQHRLHPDLTDPSDGHQLQSLTAFESTLQRHHHHAPTFTGAPTTAAARADAIQAHDSSEPFALLGHDPKLPIQVSLHEDGIGPLQQHEDLFGPPEDHGHDDGGEGDLDGLGLIPNPPNLDEWRQRLFDVNETIVMSEDESVYRDGGYGRC